MAFRPAGGLYQCRRTPSHRNTYQVILKEYDPETTETRVVFYHDCPVEVDLTDTDKITYNLDRAAVVTWSGSTGGRQPMPLSRGGWS